MITRRAWSAAGLMLAASARSAGAQTTSSRSIRMLVGSAPGGSQDMTARLIAPGMSSRLGQSVVVENRGGGGGMLTFDPVLRATPDGTTVTTGNMGSIIINTISEPSFPIKPMADLTPVSLVADVSTVLVTRADRPWRNVEQLVAAARARPGELSWAHPGIGSSPWLAGLLLDRDAGLTTIEVPFRGGAPAVMEMLAGRIDYCFATTPTALPHVREGTLRALAVPTPDRFSLLPEVPTMVELGFNDFLVSGWFGVLTSPGTPAGTVDAPQPRDQRDDGRPGGDRRLRARGHGAAAFDAGGIRQPGRGGTQRWEPWC